MEKAFHQTKKIAIVGPESSGKSTLTIQLANYFEACYVEEYAREHLLKTDGKYSIQDLNYFAKKQLLNEQQSSPCNFIFCDTNPLSVRVWSLYKYGKCDEKINQLVKASNYDLHLLLKPDLPYEDDPLREDSPLKNRIELFELFEKELINNHSDYTIIGGQKNLRVKNAIKVIQNNFSI